jgi:glycosyltransferase involved in cell wall biosynthesis
MAEILYDARWFGNHGIGRFAAELHKLLPALVPFQAPRKPWHPLDPFLLGMELRSVRPKLFFSPGYNAPVGWHGSFAFALHDLNHLCVTTEGLSTLKRAYYSLVIKPSCHRAKFVLTVSEYSRNEIATWAKINAERIINVGNGVGPPFTPIGRRYAPGYRYLLYAGSKKPHKNLPRLLQAYAISGVRSDMRLLFSGRPNKELLTECERLGLRDDVRFADFPSNDTLAEAYRGALGFLFPSLYEGFGLPPLEALACGVPVLTSNVCAIPEVMGDAAILVNPVDVEEIAEGIRRLVQDSTLRLQLCERGLQRASQFTWEKTALKTAQVLEWATGIKVGMEILTSTSSGGT